MAKENEIDWVKAAEMGCLNFIHCSGSPKNLMER